MLGHSFHAHVGYQSQFESLFAEIYDLPECNRQNYFDEVQIQHIPRYAYGEEIAVLVERTGDRLSLKRSYESFTEMLLEFTGPWEEKVREAEQIPTGDILISYNDRDLAQAKALGEALRHRGFNPWIAHDQVPPGRPFHPAILQEIAQTSAVICLVGSQGFMGQRLSEMQVALGREEIPLIPLFLPNAKTNNIHPALRKLHRVDVKWDITDEEVLDKIEWGLTGKKPSRATPDVE